MSFEENAMSINTNKMQYISLQVFLAVLVSIEHIVILIERRTLQMNSIKAEE